MTASAKHLSPLAIRYESLLLPVTGESTLCLHRLRRQDLPPGPPVFMLHGAVENGQIFFARKGGKGLAYYLASRGFDVFVADLRGRGGSFPAIGPHAPYGQTEAITEDIPCFIQAIQRIHPQTPQIWIAHSWGGVLLSSYLARSPETRSLVRCCIYLASKRSVQVKNLPRFVYIDLIWNTLCPLLAKAAGYLPAKKLKLGSDNETNKSLQQSIGWVKLQAWVDTDDHFPYGQVLKHGPRHPPVLMLTGRADRCLGHPDDVYRFQLELCAESCSYVILSRDSNALHDYDHINILTHPDAPLDHFPKIVEWIEHGKFIAPP